MTQTQEALLAKKESLSPMHVHSTRLTHVTCERIPR